MSMFKPYIIAVLSVAFFTTVDSWESLTTRPDSDIEPVDVLNHTEIEYIDGLKLTVQGKLHKEANFRRLPVQYKGVVRPVVWNLSRHSAGINVRFTTNSPEIWVRWGLENFTKKANMTDIGASGIDLYCKKEGKWQYVNSGIPQGMSNEALLIKEMDLENKEFLLNLPLYEGVTELEIGVLKGTTISAVNDSKDSMRPVIFYGTSITQGASASRPGMAYPSIISRNLYIETINLGFSGNGKFERSIGQVICDINPSLLVVDCTPNSSPEVIDQNALDLILQIRECHPELPILLVESIIRAYSYFRTQNQESFGSRDYIKRQNARLKQVFNNAMAADIDNLFYLEGHELIGHDHEATVDGTHLSDLGMVRIASKIQSRINHILSE